MNKNKPSATAMFVTKGIYHSIHQKKLANDIPEDVKKYNTKLIEHFHHFNWPVLIRWRVFISGIAQHFSIKGFFLHFLLRKKCIEKQVTMFIESGIEQVIVLGAGYDTLCSRLAERYPKIIFIEVDHPATADNKVAIFKELAWQRSNIQYYSCDLKNIETLIANAEINKNSKTVFVCEGVLMYLLEKDVEKLFTSITKNFKGECKFIFTYMEESQPGAYVFKNASGFVNMYLQKNSEPFTWGIKPENISDFLKKNNWKLNNTYDYNSLRSNFLSEVNRGLPIAMGENVAICEKL